MKLYLQKQIEKPIWQAIFVFAAALVLMLINVVINLMIPDTSGKLFPWAIATAFMLFFVMLNSLQSLRADSFVKYWQASMYSYMLLAFWNAMIAWGFSGTSISDAESYKWIFLVVSIGFIVFLSMVNFMKVIVKFAEKEEWTEPRKRK